VGLLGQLPPHVAQPAGPAPHCIPWAGVIRAGWQCGVHNTVCYEHVKPLRAFLQHHNLPALNGKQLAGPECLTVS